MTRVTPRALAALALAGGALGDEVVAAHVAAVPPAGLDALRPFAQHPRLRFAQAGERLRARLDDGSGDPSA